MKEDIFGGFSAVAQSISDRTNSIEAESEGGEELPTAEEIAANLKLEEEAEQLGKEGTDEIPFREDPSDEEDGEDDEDDEDPKGGSGSEGDSDPDLGTNFGEAEPDLAAYLQDRLFEGFGFEKGEEEFKSVEDVIDFVKKVVDENSKPSYADETLALADEYVKEGGKLEEFLETVKGGVNPATIDIDSYKDQKSVITELLKTKGYSEAKITRAIDRYEDAGVLKEEAEDALEMIEEAKEGIAEKLLEQQRIDNDAQIKKQQKYVGDVKKEIEGLKDVRGITLTKREKKDLFDYIFKPTRSGKTKYQEDYVKSQRNMIESAFFTMKGDTLVQKVQKKATSEAASRLKKRLANKGLRVRNESGQGGNTVSDIWDMASSQLRNPF